MSVDKVQGEHEVSATIHVDIFYIDEPEPRKPSVYFERMKRSADAAGAVCAISGQPHPQYHHLFCEYAARDEIDWVLVKGIATGALAHMPVLDLVTDQPIPGQFFPAEASLLFKFCKWLEVCFGMDWAAFDPADPVVFVDSVHNMLPLHAKFHIHKNHGIHLSTFPEWILQIFPKKAGFLLMPDEMTASQEAA
ncbi:MAG TPA: hypothetical protein DIT28_10035 [Oxalobacteraceae bacterium]|nr:hypothetical protein [Oxalobacteraceae bacterium]